MHPRLERLYIHNYRCFVDFELRPENRCLLLGYNGTGKTSIFEVLEVIQDIVVNNLNVDDVFLSRTLSKLVESEEQCIEMDIASEWGTFRYELHVLHDERRQTCTIASERVTLNGAPLYDFSHGTVSVYRDDHSTFQSISYSAHHSFLASIESNFETNRLLWLKSYIDRIKVLRVTPATMNGTAKSSDIVLERDGSNFAAWCRNLLADDPDNVQRARKGLQEVLDGFESIRMQQDGRSRVLVVKWRHPDGGTYELDFDVLSDGQKALITLYIVLHGIAPHASLLCLDEPDNFVSIREIQPFLVELNTISEDTGLQPLIISHTSEVIDYLGAERAILFERPDGAPTRVGQLVTKSPLRLSQLMARGWHVED